MQTSLQKLAKIENRIEGSEFLTPLYNPAKITKKLAKIEN